MVNIIFMTQVIDSCRLITYYSRGGKRQTAYPSVKSFDSCLAKKALTAGSDFLFGPDYIGIRDCFELNLSANMFCWAMYYFHIGA